MSRIRMFSLMICVILMLALVACNQNHTDEQVTSEATTEAATEEMTTAEQTQETPTTEAQTTQTETQSETTEKTDDSLAGRDQFADDDPNNPYLNLIAVGMSYDGMTTCYDGRYDFGYTVCVAEGVEFSCIQDALDFLAADGYGGTISISTDINVCLKLNIPQDGEFYRIYYNWKNCDFVYNYGVVYDDQNPVNEIIGYAYYSDLMELDWINGLENTYVWIFTEHEGFAPGRYLLTSGDGQGEFYYAYNKVEESFEWLGLPRAEVLPE